MGTLCGSSRQAGLFSRGFCALIGSHLSFSMRLELLICLIFNNLWTSLQELPPKTEGWDFYPALAGTAWRLALGSQKAIRVEKTQMERRGWTKDYVPPPLCPSLPLCSPGPSPLRYSTAPAPCSPTSRPVGAANSFGAARRAGSRSPAGPVGGLSRREASAASRPPATH